MLCAIQVLEKSSQAVQEVKTRRSSPKDIEGRPRSIENCLKLKLFPNISVNKSKKTPRNMRTHEPTRVNSSTCSSRRTTREDTPWTLRSLSSKPTKRPFTSGTAGMKGLEFPSQFIYIKHFMEIQRPWKTLSSKVKYNSGRMKVCSSAETGKQQQE